MNTLETYRAGFAREKQNDIQKKAVSDYLEELREINRDFVYDIGLPACGRIKNVGGRIHELRKEGWQINTTIRKGVCWYVLIAKPQAVTLAPLQARRTIRARHSNYLKKPRVELQDTLDRFILICLAVCSSKKVPNHVGW